MALPTSRSTAPDGSRSRLTAPGIILGVGLGGFLDGILLHQVLQWHHMLTSTDTDTPSWMSTACWSGTATSPPSC